MSSTFTQAARLDAVIAMLLLWGVFVGEPIEAWGDYVYAKVNAIEVLRKELSKLSPEDKKAAVFLSSVTDPYQPLEAKYKLTRQALQAFIDAKYTGPVGILTSRF